MSITITGSPKEIAALVDELQERRAENESRAQVNRVMKSFWEDPVPQTGSRAITTDKIADYGPTAEKLGDPTLRSG